MQLFPTAYFGSISYYQRLCGGKDIVIDGKEHFIKQTLRSRCEILGPNGVHTLSIPVIKHSGSKTPTDEVYLAETNWRKLHWKAIETAYGSAPYFDYYGMEVEELLSSPVSKLIELNTLIHQRICSWLDLEIPFQFADRYLFAHEVDTDLRMTDFNDANNLLMQKYTQVFRSKQNCLLNLSILDLIFNEGPLARNWVVGLGC